MTVTVPGAEVCDSKTQLHHESPVPKKSMAKLRLSMVFMVSAIILIAAFQFYWIRKLYDDEWNGLKKESDVVFREAIYKLQLQRFRNGNSVFIRKEGLPDNLFAFDVIDSIRTKLSDSIGKIRPGGGHLKNVTIMVNRRDAIFETDTVAGKIASMRLRFPHGADTGEARAVKFFSGLQDNNTDSLPVSQLDSGYKAELLKNNIALPFTILTTKQMAASSFVPPGQLATGIAYVGLNRNYGYMASLNSPGGYLLNKIKLPVLFSLLLLGFTTASFIFLYRNLAAQQKLAALKNEFIANITHELKTPVATVSVAIEALRNFNALQNPERTREYLDISALELQRLALLVDKVLKLSMLENREIELKKEKIDLLQLAAEIITAMKLQFDKAGATIQLTHEGAGFMLLADRLHITSVLYNLLDNALKYSPGQPAITVHIAEEGQTLSLAVTDNGMGIPAAYVDKVFQKFFRVPSGDRHNIKGYGLGLSYVQHIVHAHNGTIGVTSAEGKGSTFTVKLHKL